MRTRIISNPRRFSSRTASLYATNPNGSTVDLASETGGPGASSIDFRKIEDAELPKGARVDKTRTNYVDHLKISGDVERKKVVFTQNVYPYDSITQVWSDIDIHETNLPILPSDSSIAIACDEALRFFAQGCSKEEVSIPLFLWELSEVKRLVKTVRSLFDGNTSSRHQLPVSEEFGVSPVIRDLQNTYDMLFSVADRLKWMRENDGKPVRVRFTKELPTASVLSTAIPYYSWPTWHKMFRKSYCKFRAHARIRYNVRYLGDAEIQLRLLLTSLGFLTPAKVVWDHIPFSFLVDKFYDIGSLLERFSIPFVFNHVIEDMGWSIKVDETYQWWYTRMGEGYCVSETRKTFYRRRRGLTLTFQSPAFADPSVEALAWGRRFLSLAK